MRPCPEVCVTWMPASAVASMSIDALNAPVDAIILSLGSRSMTVRGSGDRSRITMTTSKERGLRSASSSASKTWSLKTVISARAAVSG